MYVEQLGNMWRDLLVALNDPETDVQKAAHKALSAIAKAVPKEDQVEHVDHVRGVIRGIVSDAKYKRKQADAASGEFLLPGFNLPRGLEPVLPMLQQALMTGSAEQRESAANGLSEVVKLTSAAALKPFLIKVTGPLIRVVGDRFAHPVKAAILTTLTLLLDKGGPMLKPFLPQLQTTCVCAPHAARRTPHPPVLERVLSLPPSLSLSLSLSLSFSLSICLAPAVLVRALTRSWPRTACLLYLPLGPSFRRLQVRQGHERAVPHGAGARRRGARKADHAVDSPRSALCGAARGQVRGHGDRFAASLACLPVCMLLACVDAPW